MSFKYMPIIMTMFTLAHFSISFYMGPYTIYRAGIDRVVQFDFVRCRRNLEATQRPPSFSLPL